MKFSNNLKRMTKRDEYGNADIIGVDSADLQLNLEYNEFCRVTEALNRLADYEDTCWEPQEIEKLKRELYLTGTYVCKPKEGQ